MNNKLNSANQKIQDLMTLYDQLDRLPNRNQWFFDPQYQDGTSCAFVFSHTTTDVSQRLDTLNLLANVLSHGGIKASIIARQRGSFPRAKDANCRYGKVRAKDYWQEGC